jgi:hypothetical protein
MKFLYTLLLVCIYQISTTAQVHAGAVIGATFPQQIVQNATALVGNVSGALTAGNTSIDMINNTIVKPISTGLINVAQQQIANSIIDWVNGGFEGQPLIISNPEKFILDQGRAQVKGLLDGIPTDSIFGDSIFNNIVTQYKDGNDIAKQLKALSKSNIPGLIQENLCNDQTLTSLAISDVGGGSGGYMPGEVATRKNELFNYACAGDANNDPETAAKILELDTQVQASRGESLGGMDAFLAITGGDNAYTKGALAIPVVKQAEATKQEAKKNEIFQGAGPVSQTKCVEYGETPPGEDPICLREETLTPGEAIASSLEKAANAGLDRLTNLTGEGLMSLITNLALTKLTAGLNKAISGATSGSNTPEVVITRRPPSKDLVADPVRKKEIQSPMQKQFDFYSKSLDELKTVDESYLADVNAYQSKINTGIACYNGLVSDGILRNSSSQYTSAQSFYNNRNDRINRIKNALNPELASIAGAKTLIVETKNKIAASDSTEEISEIFNDYSSKIDSGEYPQPTIVGTRKAEQQQDQSNADQDNTNITNYQNTCEQIRATYNGGGDNGGGNPGGA